MTIIGIDNGVTGSLACYFDTPSLEGIYVRFYPIPTKKEQSYTKKKQTVTRVDFTGLWTILNSWSQIVKMPRVYIERPYVNPTGFKATTSAIRALEATLIVLEECRLPYEYIDSRQWQKVMLPAGLKGTAELKKASMDIGCRLFPEHAEAIRKHKDADSLLIAEWARRMK